MPHPKRKFSKSRTAKRRTHYKAEAPTLTTCQTTGVVHLPHRAYTVDGNVYYNGKVLIEKAAVA
ncbi:MAG: 50S ribosomal protein L32 [Bacteroidota bacterium]|jgi:large subunit ribosomal protein L32